MKKKLIFLLVAGLSLVAGFVAARWLLVFIVSNTPWYWDTEVAAVAIIWSLAFFVLPLLCGFGLARGVTKKYLPGWGFYVTPAVRMLKKKWILWPLITSYIITWVFGLPAIQSANTDYAIDEFGKWNRGGQITEEYYGPSTRTIFSFPILPFVGLSYYEYQAAGLVGEDCVSTCGTCSARSALAVQPIGCRDLSTNRGSSPGQRLL